MILGTGIDIISIDRIKNTIDKYNARFIQKILTENEQKELLNLSTKNQIYGFVAKKFAIKEAISKALGSGINNKYLSFTDIEIHHNHFGKPIVSKNIAITDVVRKINNIGAYNIHISISDERNFVIANAILETTETDKISIFNT